MVTFYSMCTDLNDSAYVVVFQCECESVVFCGECGLTSNVTVGEWTVGDCLGLLFLLHLDVITILGIFYVAHVTASPYALHNVHSEVFCCAMSVVVLAKQTRSTDRSHFTLRTHISRVCVCVCVLTQKWASVREVIRHEAGWYSQGMICVRALSGVVFVCCCHATRTEQLDHNLVKLAINHQCSG